MGYVFSSVLQIVIVVWADEIVFIKEEGTRMPQIRRILTDLGSLMFLYYHSQISVNFGVTHFVSTFQLNTKTGSIVSVRIAE